MVLGWSRAIYVEFVRRADVATFMGCHLRALEYFGGMPRRCLYDNAKVVVRGRDEEGRPEWNRRMLDLSLRAGFEIRLCRPYRAQTNGKVESGAKYVRGNPCSSQGQALWPSIRFTDDAGLNRQALEWCDSVANRRRHGTTWQAPESMLADERPQLGKVADRATLAPYPREDRQVARDGFVSWEGSRYGVYWRWVGATVQVGQRLGTVEIWGGGDLIAVHPRAQRSGQRFTLPGQREGLPMGGERSPRVALAVQVPVGQVERRLLDVYELVAGSAR